MLAILIGLVAGTLAWAVFVYRSDRFERESFKSLAFVGGVGGLAALLASMLLEGAAALIFAIEPDPETIGGVGNAAFLALISGLFEESAKAGATVILIRRRTWFNEPVDAVIYAMTVGLGFAMFENAGYAIQGGLANVVARTLMATPMHVGVAALWGVGIARARFGGGDRWFACMWPWAAVAAFVHAVYNFAILASGAPAVVVLVNIPCVVALLVVARRLTRRLSGQSPFRPASFCSDCNVMNPPDAAKCGRCGRELTPPPPADPVS